MTPALPSSSLNVVAMETGQRRGGGGGGGRTGGGASGRVKGARGRASRAATGGRASAPPVAIETNHPLLHPPTHPSRTQRPPPRWSGAFAPRAGCPACQTWRAARGPPHPATPSSPSARRPRTGGGARARGVRAGGASGPAAACAPASAHRAAPRCPARSRQRQRCTGAHLLGRRVVGEVLVVNGGVDVVAPRRLLHRQPLAVGAQPRGGAVCVWVQRLQQHAHERASERRPPPPRT